MQLNTNVKNPPGAAAGRDNCLTAVLAADVKLGLAAALTGPAAKYGIAIKNGFTLAADEVNAKVASMATNWF